MYWNELTIRTSQEAKEAVANILHEHGANGVVIEEPLHDARFSEDDFVEIDFIKKADLAEDEVILKAYFVAGDSFNQIKQDIEREIAQLVAYGIKLGKNEISTKTVHESDWENEWKKYYKPLEIGETFLIVPEWEEVTDTDKKRIIRIDPGMAFGTGMHETTSLSIRALENVVAENDVVIDVGSGSGILSIAACFLGAKHVYSYDVDAVAVRSTQRNRDLNQLTDKISVAQNNLLEGKTHVADVIVANILAHIIMKLIADAWHNLKQDGYFITSGIILTEEDNVKKKLCEQGFAIIDRLQENHWVTLIARKR